nr:hypothetical protein BaRGS_032841 [Batillaria attramentaria]
MERAPVEGVRVLRGPHWDAGDEDGGEGHLGTVLSSPSNGVVHVVWDTGQESTCRAGADGKFDLRVFDTATVDDKHNVRHQFRRIDFPGHDGPVVKKRKISVRIRAMGMFPGAKVTRGKDWSWRDQDGGEGSEGEMLEFFQLKDPQKGKRNLVRVAWPHGKKNVYRLGYEGHVDVMCSEEEAGGFYYRDHLPCLGDSDNTEACEDESTVQEPATDAVDEDTKEEPPNAEGVQDETSGTEEQDLSAAKEGDGAAGGFDTEDTLRDVHENEPAAEEAVELQGEKCGELVLQGDTASGQFTETQDVASAASSTETQDASARERHTEAKAEAGSDDDADAGGEIRNMADAVESKTEIEDDPDVFKVGDRVAIKVSEERLQEFQIDFGGTTSTMLRSRGKVGTITEIDSDGDVTVSFGHRSMMYAPAACRPAPGAKPDTLGDSDSRDYSNTDDNSVVGEGSGRRGGLMERFSQFLKDSHQGKLKVVRALLDIGADVNAEGLKEQAPLGVALEEREEEVAMLLLERGADPRHKNGKQRTPLHMAVFNRMNEVAQILIHMGADVNVQDKYGDTPLHDAIARGNTMMLDLLLQLDNVQVNLVNRKGYTPLQLACRVSNAQAVINNFLDGIRLLVINGGANINIQSGADVNVQEYDGETALHLAMGGTDGKDKSFEEREKDVQTRIRISTLLITNGAFVDAENRKGKPPTIYGHAEIQLAVQQFIQKNPHLVKLKASSDNDPRGPTRSYATTSVLKDVSLPCTQCGGPSDVTLVPCAETGTGAEKDEAISEAGKALDTDVKQELSTADNVYLSAALDRPITEPRHPESQGSQTYGIRVLLGRRGETENEQKKTERPLQTFGGPAEKPLQTTGTVVEVAPRGTVRVKFSSLAYKFNPAALIKVPHLSTGDTVRIVSDLDLYRLLNKRVGWCSDVHQVLGKVGKITQVDKDGDVTVSFGPRSILFAPATCCPAPGATPDALAEGDVGKDSPESRATGESADALMKRLAEMVKQGATVSQAMSSSGDSDSAMSRLFHAIKEGNSQAVKAVCQSNPSLDRYGDTALIDALQKNRREAADILLKVPNVNVLTTNHKGVSALHVAAIHGNVSAIEQILELDRSEVNSLMGGEFSALHIAANDDFEDVNEMNAIMMQERVRIACTLISNGAFVDAENSKGRTPMRYGPPEVQAQVQDFMDKNRSLVQKKGRTSADASRPTQSRVDGTTRDDKTGALFEAIGDD